MSAVSLRGVPNVPKAFGRTTWQSRYCSEDFVGAGLASALLSIFIEVLGDLG